MKLFQSPRGLESAPFAMPPIYPRPESPAPDPAVARPGPHRLLPLPFDPKSLRGISERLIVSHHEHNYGAAIRGLNQARERIAALPADAPPFLVAGLRERELSFRNSAVLHEHYFANLGGDGRRGTAVERALADAWGSAGRWEAEFRATAASLSGGSGWTILALDPRARTLGISWSGHHSQGPAGALPILVLDMYEHAYQLDHGAEAARYVDAFFANANWEEAERRLDGGLRAAAALAG